ncbi:MAG TPA: sigma 54-interacting transcriptional regulator, partial [Kiloniellaceae bacterium]|nr:sigma 54-interacting transcriptional regulator [Kiloniellaceae bacterium]
MVRFTAIDSGGAEISDAEGLALVASPVFAELLDRLPDGVIILDDGARVRAANRMALDINGLHRGDPVGLSFAELAAASRLDWSGAEKGGDRRRDFHASSDDGRAILTSIRELRDGGGRKRFTLILQRDLQVLDHLRRTASDIGGGKVFKFLSERDIVPDFEAQKALSPAIERTVTRSMRALHQGARLLLLGESGCGKTELAHYLHRVVGTREEPFVHVNCGAIPESLFESEMFG